MATPASSSVFVALSLAAISLLVLALLRRYLTLRSTPAFVLVPVFLALALPASIVLLVPIDLASSPPDSRAPAGIWLSARFVLVFWRIAYWLTFVLTWAILPFLGEYLDSGHRSPRERMLYSLRSNARYQLIVLSSGLLGLIYLAVTHELRFSSLRGLVMALAYAWGLVLAIYLLGHGLVALPRKMWRAAWTAAGCAGCSSELSGIEMQEWVDELVDLAAAGRGQETLRGGSAAVQSLQSEGRVSTSTGPGTSMLDSLMPGPVLSREALACQTILDAASSKRRVFDSRSSLSSSSPSSPSPFSAPLLTPYLRYVLYTHVLPAIYICISDAQVWGNRALVPRNTYPESACWYAGQVARLTVPLAYNFLTLLPRDLQLRTTFYDFLGKGINLTLLGEGFDLFFPLFILLPVAATMFNLYGKVKGLIGLGDMEINDEEEEDNPSGFGTGGWREGRSLVETELNGPGYLGLSSTRTPRAAHGGTIPDTLPRYRDAPPSSTTAAATTTPAARASTNTNINPISNSTSISTTRPADEDDDEDEGFFQSFAHRVRNTIDTASTPKWLQDVDAGFKRPRWMGGTDDEAGPGPSSSSPSTDSSAFARWFGGGSGGVRL
ncbi:LMBR1 domain-containing protein [Nannizzia gypsea CBS 118893]|uniref:LMBR1 domain-containing protein n=1 Tax=Arthroderma gypseum (strain ATCC MYA-4604 / CBS 118893) TaxID=535722 RepID=E5QYW5_ARTGP|nr:LMBR1 domain-containing protein [Nannizzia gypsea CBS 118893]EFQ98088.1 LMBR1 domain-containing protein [Nannizzia gypsea CBS 118893]